MRGRKQPVVTIKTPDTPALFTGEARKKIIPGAVLERPVLDRVSMVIGVFIDKGVRLFYR